MSLILLCFLRSSMNRNQEGLGLFDYYPFVSSSVDDNTYKLKSIKAGSRIALITVLTGGILIYYYWEAELTSHLASRRIDFPFNNLFELSQTSEFNFIVAKGTAHLDYFKNSEDPIMSKIWKEKLEPYFDRLPFLHEVHRRILADPYTVGYTDSLIKMTNDYITCKIVDIKPPIRKTKMAFATQKNSPYYQAFKHHMTILKEAGLIQKFIKNHRMEAQVCKDYSGKPVTIQQCHFAFLILAAGAFLAFLGIIFEFCLRPKLMKGNANYVIVNKNKAKRWGSRKILPKCQAERGGLSLMLMHVNGSDSEEKSVDWKTETNCTLQERTTELQKRKWRFELRNQKESQLFE